MSYIPSILWDFFCLELFLLLFFPCELKGSCFSHFIHSFNHYFLLLFAIILPHTLSSIRQIGLGSTKSRSLKSNHCRWQQEKVIWENFRSYIVFIGKGWKFIYFILFSGIFFWLERSMMSLQLTWWYHFLNDFLSLCCKESRYLQFDFNICWSFS